MENITNEQMTEARAWIMDAFGGTLDAVENGDYEHLTDEQIVKGIERHYEGGWDAFVRECRPSAETDVQVGQRVQRTDYENDGTPAYKGFIARIEPDEFGPTYWVQWEGTSAPDAHGRYAFAPLPDAPEGWTVEESMPLSQSHVVQVLQSGATWAVRTMRPWGEYGLSFCASESDARELYASAIENGV